MVLVDDATHSYRGYRLQALYILWRILSSSASKLIYQPEGKEDLAIYSTDDELLEINQIKAHDNNLTLSALSPDKENSFFYRMHQEIRQQSNLQIQIVSFGSFGQKFYQALLEDGPDRSQEASKLAAYGYLGDADALHLFEIITPQEVQENLLHDALIEIICKSLMVEPDTALEMLMYWIYWCSEHQIKITLLDLEQKIHKVGKVIHERASYQREWYTTIEPILNRVPLKATEELKQEFYRGVSAKYEHILVNLDVVRTQKLEKIHQAFQRSQVIIVHGVSGQGKSTLAFRYLHDYVGEQFRFYVHSPENRNQALSIARAISGQAEAINIPMLLHIDVRPSETHWTDTVRQLVSLPNIYILVTIREDDLRRAQFDDTDFSFETVELRMDRDEAKEIYKLLGEQQSPYYTSFDDAWRKFTADSNLSPLMEFIYLLTQGESLRSRLKRQIQILEDEVVANKFEVSVLDLLRIIATASAFGARLDRRILVEKLELKAANRLYEKLEKEYLVRLEDALVDGVHPLRSQILEELLRDEFTSWERDISVLLSCIYEPDLGFFLLNLFVTKPSLVQSTVNQLSAYAPQTWEGIAGILRALVWRGIHNFVDTNEVILRQAYEKFGIGALMFLNADLLGVSADSQAAVEKLAELNDAGAKAILHANALSARLKAANDILSAAQQWLNTYAKVAPRLAPPVNWGALTEIIFWSRHFEISQLENLWMPSINDRSQLDQLSVAELADLSLALSHKAGGGGWHVQQSDYLILRFMQETLTFAVDKSNPLIPNLHFIFDFELMEDKDDIDEIEQRNLIHSETVKRVRYFLYLFPEYEKAGAQGYGHRVHGLDIHDESFTSGIPRTAFPMKWLVWGNSIYTGLFYWMFRDNDWRLLAQKSINLRKKIVQALNQYEREVDRYFASRRSYNLFERLAKKYIQDMVQSLMTPQLLPKVAVDPWGFTTESEQEAHESKIVQPKGILIKALKPYWTVMREYISTLQNFFAQSEYPLKITSADFRITAPEAVKGLYALSGSNSQHLGSLSVHNLTQAALCLQDVQFEFRRLMHNFVNPALLNRLEKNEYETLQRLHALWCYFVFEPHRTERLARSNFVNTLGRHVHEIEQRIVDAFQLALPQAEIQILDERVKIDTHRYKVLILNHEDGLKLYSTITQQLPQILQSVLQTIESGSSEFYAVEREMPHLLIILLVEGQLLLPMAYRVMPTVFTTQSEPKPINFVPLPISNEMMSQLKLLGVDLYDGSEAVLSRDLFLTYKGFQVFVAHILDIVQVAIECESCIDQGVIAKYYAKWFARLKEECAKALEITAAIDTFIHDLPFENQDTKDLSIRTFGTVLAHRDWLNEILAENNGISLTNLQEWKGLLDKMLDHLLILQISITSAVERRQELS